MITLLRPMSLLFLLLGIVSVGGHLNRPYPSLLPLVPTSNINTNSNVIQLTKLSPLMRSILKLRGGEDEEDEESEDEVDVDVDVDESPSSAIDYSAILEKVVDVTKDAVDFTKDKIVPVVVKYSKKGAVTTKKTSISIYRALHRAICAALEGEESEESEDSDEDDSDDEGDEVVTLMDKVIAISKKTVIVVKRMVKAALTVPEEEGDTEDDDVDEADEDDDVTAEPTEEKNVETSTAPETPEVESIKSSDSIASDFGSYLAEAYGVDDKRNSGKNEGPIILGGSLQDALQIARQKARMLLVFIPAERPKGERGLSFFGGKKGNAESEEKDKIAIESLLSLEVGKAANRKARKKQGNDNLGSFAVWGAKAGSSEAASAIKQLKAKEASAKGEKRPILCVVYPAVAAGSDKLVPKVLAQHHCNPPLKAESMASWMNALRKRYSKQYQSMQKGLEELKFYQERQEGYIDSVQSDNERKQKEAQEEAERKAQEIKEAARQAEIDARRQELQQSLPEDVKNGSNVKKIALRFSDGRSGQRGFSSDQPLSVVFNWVDAMFEIERESVVLTTLNGKQTFSWNDDETKNGKTLEDAGLNKMTAFRVTESA